jgi:hypothetical protein
MARTLFVLGLIGVATMTGFSQETASEYVSPSEAVPRGRAPKMQVQLLNPEEPTKQYAVSSTKEMRLFPDCWSLRRGITLRVHISPPLEH